MKKIYTVIFVCLLACTTQVFAQVNPATLTGNGNLVKVDPTKIDPRISAMLNFYDKQIYFTQNKGQWSDDVLFKADFPLGQAVATSNGMVVGTYDPQATAQQSAQFERKEQAEHDGVKFNEEDIKVNAQGWIMNFLNHSESMHIEGKTQHADYSNYFEGRDESKYANNVNSYQEIWYDNVYDNVDVRYYPSQQGTLEYDIVCKPGFDKNNMALQLTGISKMYLKNNGHLVLHTGVGDMEFPSPVAYQKINGVKKPVAAKYILRNNVLRFDVGAFDATQPLIIDPIALRWATWMTNNSTAANHNHCIWVDQKTGYIYVIARVASSGLITVNPLTGYSTYQGTGDDCEIGEYIEPDTIGNPGEREWQTYLGGNAEDNPYALEQAANGDLIFTGYTQSTNFPLIGGSAYTGGGASINDAASSTKEKIFVTKINTAGNSFKSAVIGGNGVDAPFDLRTTASSDILVCGNTTSTNLGSLFTGATNASSSNGQDVLVFRLNNDLSSVTWMDNYGGTGIDGATIMNTNLITGDIFVAGRTTSTNFPTKNPRQSSIVGTDDGFIQKLNSNGGIIWSSYFQAGGSKDSVAILCMELNTTETSVYIGGITNGLATANISSSGVKYPTKTGTVNFFVAKMDTNQHFDEATYLGGGSEVNMMGLNLDLNNDVYILGYTASNAFPVTTANALQKSFRGGGDDETFTKLRTDLDSLDYSTYFGGSHDDYDPVGERGIKFFNCRIFTVFTSESNNVPLTKGAITTNKISGSTTYEPGICVWANPPDLANNTITTSQHICKGSIPASFTGSVPSYILPQISRDGVDSVYPVTLNSATTYDWQSSIDSINWVDVPGGTTQNLSNSLIGTINQTTYFRRVIGGDACIIAGAAEQTVVVTVTSVGANVTDVSCHGAKNGSITAVPTGPAPYNVKWNTGATSLTISSLDTGTYSVTITDGNSCTYSNSFKVTQPDSLKVSIQSQVSPTSCAGGNGSITANTPTGGTSPYKYQWTPSGGTGLTASALVAGTYTLTVTDANSCTATTTCVLPQPTKINVSINVTKTTVCSGSADTLNAVASGGTGKYTYSWAPGGSTHDTIIINPTAATTYTVTATDGNECSNSAQQIINVNPLPTVSVSAAPGSTICNGSSTTLNASGATSYTWSPATGLSATTGSSVSASPIITTTYTVTGTNATNCTNTSTIVVNVNQLPTINVPTPSPICNGTSTTLNASGAVSYTWSPDTGLSSTTGSSVSANPTTTTTYTITGTNANNCSNFTTVIVSVNQLPTISVPTPSPICNGTSTTLTASGATTYTWLPATGLSATTGSSVSANPTANTTYTITGINANNCTNSTTVTVSVNQLPTISAPPPSPICNGTSTTLTASGASTYTWLPATGLSATTGSSVSASPTANTTYTITGTNANNCSNSTTVVVAVNQLPTISVPPPSPICNGTSTTLTASGAVSYTWSPATGLSATTGSSVSASPTANTTYTITGTNANNCSNSTTVVVAVNQLPTISVPPPSPICNGTSTTLTASGASTYTWLPTTGLSATTGSSVSASPTASTTYTITGTDGNNCSNTTTVAVSVNQLPTISVPTPAPICNGTSTTLTASGAVSYTWSPATGLSATTGSSVSANPAATTTYTITGTDGNNCSNSTTVAVSVNQLPTISVPTPSPICNGTSTTLTASGAVSYTWSPATGLSATTGSSVSASPTANTTYTITGTNANNCSNSTTVVVAVNQLPTISVPPPSPICNGTSTTLTASGATTYTWLPATGLSATTGSSVSANPTANTTYTITGTDGNNCSNSTTVTVSVNQLPTINVPTPAPICNGTSTTLTASGATSYTWSPATGLSATTGSSVSASPTANTTYTITGTDGNNCSNSTTVTVSVNQLPTINVPAPAPICNGTSTTLTASGATTYTWSPATGLSATTGSSVSASPTANTTYTIIGSDGNNCTNSTTVTVSVNQLPTINVPAPSPICNGTSTTLTASGANTYTWSPATGLSATTGSSVSANPAATTTYTITGTDGNNCINSTTVVVAVNQLPTISVPTPSPICNGTSTTLTASGAVSYTWSPATGLSATTGSSVSASPTANTTYTITGTDGNICSNSDTVVVAVNQLPTISVPTPSPICNGTSTTLTASGAVSYTWSPATGLSATTGSSVSANPIASTTYTITGIDGNNCSNSTTVVVAVNQLPTISVPTPSPICNGTSTTLTASGASTYTWSPATGLSATTGSSVTANPSANTTYTIVGSDGNICSNSTTVVVAVNQLPTISVPAPSAPICNGTSTTLTASGAVSYTWSPATGLSATTGSSVSANPSANTTYTITGTDGNNCSNSTTVTVLVNPLPTVTIASSAPAICSGSNDTLIASGGVSYTWSPSTTLNATAGDTVIANPTVNTTYTVTGTDGNGCINTGTVAVNIIPAPQVNINVEADTTCAGVADTLKASGGDAYIWFPSTGLSATSGSEVVATPTSPIVYTVVAINNSGCVSLNPTFIVLTVNPLPTVIVDSAVICSGTSATLIASGATTYTWSPATGLNATTGSSVTANPTATTTYTVIGTNDNGCVDTAIALVTVNTTPSVQVNTPAPICTGNSTSLTASGADNYTWGPATGLDNTTGSSVNASPTSTTTYQIIGSTTAGCADTISVIVNVNTKPNVQVNTPNPICNGNSTPLTATGAATYTWSPATGLDNTTGSSVNASPTSTITYQVIGVSGTNCSDTTDVTVTVNTKPTVQVNTPAPICSGNSAALTASGADTYTWTPTTGLDNTTGSSVNASPNSTTTYQVIGTTTAGCADTTSVTVNVNTTPSVQVNTPAPICSGNSAPLTATGADNYTWTPGTGLDNTTGSSVNANPTSTTTYQVIGTTNAGCADTTSVTVNVNTKPNVQVNTPAPICSGNSTPLTATGAATYTWGPATGLDNTTGSSVNANPTSTTTYQVIGVSGTNCSDTTYVTVNVNAKPNVQVNTPAPICSGNSASLTASGAVTYTWSPATGLDNTTGSSVNASPTSTTTYQVIGVSSASCADTTYVTVNVNLTPNVHVNTPAPICSGNSAPLTATGADNYSWSPATGLDNTNGSSVNASPTATTTYQVIGRNNSGCADTTYVTVTVNTKPNVQVNTPAPICAGNSAPLTAIGAATYVWSPAAGLDNTAGSSVNASPTSTTTYQVIGVSGASCADTTTVIVTVNPLPTITVSTPTGPEICNGSTTLLMASGATTYTWSPTVGLSPTSGSPVLASPTTTTTYTVTGTDDNKCVNTGSIIVTVYPLPTITVSANPGSSICTGSSTTLTASGATTYTWSPATGLNATSGSSVTADPTVNTTYTVTGTNANNCVNTGTIVITVEPLPNVSVSAYPGANICTGSSTTLTASGATTYTWSPTTGLNATSGSSVTANPTANVTYTVTGTNNNNCVNSNTIVVNVSPLPTVSVSAYPTAILCNGGSTTLTATGANTYTWSPNTGLSATTGSSVVASPTATVTYTVTGANGNNCTNSATIKITVNPQITVTATAKSASVCPGSPDTLTASGATNYTWSPAATLNASTGAVVYASPTVATTYTVTGSNGNGCTNSTTVAVKINTPTCITKQPQPETLCSTGGKCSGSVTFCVTATGSNLTYQWQYNGHTISNTNSPCYTITPILLADTGNYDVIVTGSCGSITSNTAKLTINASPNITLQPQCATVCSGNSTQFCVTASGTALKYQWQFNGKNITNATSPCYTASNAGCYDVVVSNSCGSVTSTVVTLTINTPPVITCQPKSESVCSVGGKCSGSVTFCVTATGSNLTYQWKFNGTNINNATSSCYTINPVTTLNAGCYTVVVSNSCNSVTSGIATLTIGSAPVITAQPQCVTICSGTSTQLCVTATGTGLSYQWQFNGKNISGANSSCYTASNAGCYDVVVSNSCGSLSSSIATLTINTSPVITCQPKSESLCSVGGKCSGSVTFCVTATGSNLTYQWKFNGTSIKNATSSCYTINPVTTSNAGCYTVVVSNSCNSVTSSIATLTIGSSPVITSQPVCSTVCAGNSATFCVTAVGTGLSYQWQFNGKNIAGATSCCYTISSSAACNAGCYNVVVSNSCGSVTSSTVTLTVNAPPCITVQPVCLTVCAGSSTTFSVTANGSNLTYQWQYKGKNIGGATSSTYTVSSATTSNAGNYDVVVCNSCGSITSTIVTLTVNNCTTCNTPTNLCTTNITCTSATFSWSYSSSAAGFVVEYRANGCSTWTTVKTTTNSLILNCLFSGTTYDWSVSENCSCGSSSAYASVVSFCTSNNCCVNMDVAVKQVGGDNVINDLKIYPNPTFNTATIEGNFEKESDITIIVTDLSGRVLMSENESVLEGDYTHQLDMSKQPAGTYFLIIRTGDKMVTSKIVKIE